MRDSGALCERWGRIADRHPRKVPTVIEKVVNVQGKIHCERFPGFVPPPRLSHDRRAASDDGRLPSMVRVVLAGNPAEAAGGRATREAEIDEDGAIL
jgi:hypothetical protein